MKMLTVKVKKLFRDRYSGIQRKPGDTFTVTEARYREIKYSGDMVEIVKAPAAAPAAEKAEKK